MAKYLRETTPEKKDLLAVSGISFHHSDWVCENRAAHTMTAKTHKHTKHKYTQAHTRAHIHDTHVHNAHMSTHTCIPHEHTHMSTHTHLSTHTQEHTHMGWGLLALTTCYGGYSPLFFLFHPSCQSMGWCCPLSGWVSSPLGLSSL